MTTDNKPDATVVALSLQVAKLSERQAELELLVHSLEESEGKKHKPKETPRWHDITPEALELEIGRIRGWERDVLLPVLGYHMIPCWPLHLPAVVRLEIALELWMVLFLSKRTTSVLAAQAEYVIRTLPGLCDDVRTICSGCEHAKPKVPVAAAVAS